MRTNSSFFLQHPAILEDRRRKFTPAPPQLVIPQTFLPPEPPEPPAPKKIKRTIKKKEKGLTVEVAPQEPAAEEAITTKKTRTTLKAKKTAIVAPAPAADEDEVIDLTKKISTIRVKKNHDEQQQPENNTST